VPPITVPLRAPELASGVWVQGPEVSIGASRGRVVLVDFWEATCINCQRTLPYLVAWHERYAARGLTIVGVQTPEFELTAEPAVVAQAVAAAGLPYSILLDADRATWERFANHFWPAKYLIDARGYLRYEHFGEGAYGETEEHIQALLREAGDTAEMPPLLAPLRAEDRPGAVCHPATREIHFGWHRGRLIAAEGYRPGEDVRHAAAAELPPEGAFAARGLWRHEAEYLESREAGAEIELRASSTGVGLVVASPENGAGEVEVRVDGEPVPPDERGPDSAVQGGRTFAVWREPRLVHLLAGGPFRSRRLLLRFPNAGTRCYTLSFTTSCVAGAEVVH